MIKTILNRFEQGYRTTSYPKEKIELPLSYRGLPVLNPLCEQNQVDSCAQKCPLKAINSDQKILDLGKCVFCGECDTRKADGFVQFTNQFEFAATCRKDLRLHSDKIDLSLKTQHPFAKLFGRSLQLRQVCAGGCGACEADTNVLNTPFFDLSRFGIQFVASPRHADGIVVTGPVTRNMKTALLKTYEAIGEPKLVIALGTCAISGGIFQDTSEVIGGVDKLLPVDLYIPGCPPHPLTILYALTRLFVRNGK